jgi:hypothetical protein
MQISFQFSNNDNVTVIKSIVLTNDVEISIRNYWFFKIGVLGSGGLCKVLPFFFYFESILLDDLKILN